MDDNTKVITNPFLLTSDQLIERLRANKHTFKNVHLVKNIYPIGNDTCITGETLISMCIDVDLIYGFKTK